MNARWLLSVFLLAISGQALAQPFTRQDSLRGGNGRGRDWWDARRYTLQIDVQSKQQTVRGEVDVNFRVVQAAKDSLQIDLQEGLTLDSARLSDRRLVAIREGNVYWLLMPPAVKMRLSRERGAELILWYHGKPRSAKNPPWDGGFVWKQDANGRPGLAVACQGLGASAWWPCKDDQADEPEEGVQIHVHTDFTQTVVSNGRPDAARDSYAIVDPVTGTQTKAIYVDSFWSVHSPINLYDVTFYAGDYVHWSDTFGGEKGTLPLDFYALRENEQKAWKQFREAKPMLRCFEYWLGPYPFYEDGYKLVEAPYLGMEHQSAVAYGNDYKMGYLGRDLSNTGEGLKFDFIIIHESGHEWFGNSITAKDVADNWIHEGLCTYTEVLYLEWIAGKEAAYRYMEGRYGGIFNYGPVIGPYGVNKEGEDIYDKGAAVLHMVRLMMDDDARFRQLLRGMNREFYHQTVTTAQIEDYIATAAGLSLKPYFNLYLRSTTIPTLQWYAKGGTVHARWLDAPDGFVAPVLVQNGREKRYRALKTGTFKSGGTIKSAGLYHLVEREFTE